jgi:hypothetical protein
MRLPCGRGEDPILDELRDTFGAYPVRVPEARIVPMSILAMGSGGETIWRGDLSRLIEGDLTFPADLVRKGEVSGAFSKSSRDLDASVAVKLLDGLAAAFGFAGAMPSLEAAASSARTVRFAFPLVTRSYVDIGEVARLLGMRRLMRNAATEIFLQESHPTRMLLIDSTLRCSSFTMGSGTNGSVGFSVDIGAIQKLIGDVKLEVKREHGSVKELTFHGATELTFAFTCKEVRLKPDGLIRSFDETRQARFLGADEDADAPAVPPSYVARLEPAAVGPLDVMVEIVDDASSP